MDHAVMLILRDILAELRAIRRDNLEAIAAQQEDGWIIQKGMRFPFPLRFLLASCPELIGKVLGIVQWVLSTHLIKKTGLTLATAKTWCGHTDTVVWIVT